jgi:hypothetical protein
LATGRAPKLRGNGQGIDWFADNDRWLRHFGYKGDLREEAWQRAQQALDDPIIWGAVVRLGLHLAKMMEAKWRKLPADEDVALTIKVPGEVVHALLDRCGVRPGMELPALSDFPETISRERRRDKRAKARKPSP